MDAVNKPNHYMLFADGTEAIDVIRAALTPEEFRGYCKGNVLKYRLRAGKKDKLEQDIAKADTYAKMLYDSIPISELAARVTNEYLKERERAAERVEIAIAESEHFYPSNGTPCGPLFDCKNCKTPC